MHHSPLVHVLHSRGQLQHDVVGLILVEGVLLPDAFQQLASLKQLHHNVHMQLGGSRGRGKWLGVYSVYSTS